MTKCPKEVKSTGVSLTISPVTQTAEVEVNKASMNLNSPLWAKGRESKMAPIRIKIIKLNKINLISRVCVGDP
jgi:ribosomal protein L31E